MLLQWPHKILVKWLFKVKKSISVYFSTFFVFMTIYKTYLSRASILFLNCYVLFDFSVLSAKVAFLYCLVI